jgi:hypothetical protein
VWGWQGVQIRLGNDTPGPKNDRAPRNPASVTIPKTWQAKGLHDVGGRLHLPPPAPHFPPPRVPDSLPTTPPPHPRAQMSAAEEHCAVITTESIAREPVGIEEEYLFLPKRDVDPKSARHIKFTLAALARVAAHFQCRTGEAKSMLIHLASVHAGAVVRVANASASVRHAEAASRTSAGVADGSLTANAGTPSHSNIGCERRGRVLRKS